VLAELTSPTELQKLEASRGLVLLKGVLSAIKRTGKSDTLIFIDFLTLSIAMLLLLFKTIFRRLNSSLRPQVRNLINWALFPEIFSFFRRD
jgi:hypothetical protein